ncbi:hypothetical protein LIA77_08285 [Sarocladium implicatum]|nr:hypothetical protein LIA77_08285 [Sarocladium implicatum]
MAGLHSQAFLPSGGLDRHHSSSSGASLSSGNLSRSRSHDQRNTGFPPPAPSQYFADSYNHRPDRRTSAPASHLTNSTSSSLYRHLPSTGSHPVLHAGAISPSTIPPSSIDAAAYYASAATTHQLSSVEQPPYQSLQRSSSLSPTSGSRKNQYTSSLHPNFQPGSAGSPPSAAPIGSSLSRSVSADAAAPTQTSVHIVQRLAQQNAIIREAWEAERNYLEANRRRAEEVYQEERAIMEELREGWESEKEIMLREMQTLRERIHRLEGENATLRSVASQTVQISGVVSPMPSVKGAGGNDSGNEGLPSLSLSNHGYAPVGMSLNPSQNSAADASILPPGLNGASRRPHWASPGGGSRTSPTSQPEQSPFIPLEPRIEPQHQAARDPLPHDDDDPEPPIIDVQEVDPKLEGISLRANAIQRPTFGFGDSSHAENSKQSSPSRSPPNGPQDSTDSSRPELAKRGSSKEQTLQVLAAEESRRLTMHAGHTPNHSLSLFPTMNVTTGSSNATAPSGGPTPKAEPEEAPMKLEEPSVAEPEQQVIQPTEVPADHQSHHPSDAEQNADAAVKIIDEQLELGPLEPADDVPLKGPLMIKNIPAQDEIFWAEVNKKLEPISQGRDAVPTVMRADLEELEAAAGSSAAALLIQQRQQPRAVDPVGGGDASHDSHAGSDAPVAPRPGTSDGDVPLKLKTTTNFGAPFGVA